MILQIILSVASVTLAAYGFYLQRLFSRTSKRNASTPKSLDFIMNSSDDNQAVEQEVETYASLGSPRYMDSPKIKDLQHAK